MKPWLRYYGARLRAMEASAGLPPSYPSYPSALNPRARARSEVSNNYRISAPGKYLSLVSVSEFWSKNHTKTALQHTKKGNV